MGQYFYPACVDTSEYLEAHEFGDGLKLMEFSSGTGMVSGVATLLALPAEDERGAWVGNSARLGAWAGKRFVVTGDYADAGRFVPPEHQDVNLWKYFSEKRMGKDISHDVMRALGEVASPSHPMAVMLNMPEDRSRWSYYAPKGLEDFLDISKVADLEFESFKQLHSLGGYPVGLDGDEREQNFVRALGSICRKFAVQGPNAYSLEVKVSEDGMHVESVNFWLNGARVTWRFPIAAKTVYAALRIIKPDSDVLFGKKSAKSPY